MTSSTSANGSRPKRGRYAAAPADRTKLVDGYLEKLWQHGGTDLLLTAGAPALLRINGELTPYDNVVLDEDEVAKIIASVLGDRAADELEYEGEVDFSFSWADRGRLRGNAFRQRETMALALRLIPFMIPALADLGVPAVVGEDMVTKPHGLVLVTGPTGSGKSTTLAAMIDQINTTRACHILTIEDPIEYLHMHKRSAVNQREIGSDSASFASALRAVLREDPDVVLIGEMRDPESIQAALTIAETGHLVFATLHTNDSGQAIDRIVDVFPAERRPQIQVQLSHVLLGVIYQRLVPRVDEGLCAAYEVMVGNHAIRNLIREGKSRQLRNVVATHQAERMQTLEMHLAELVANGTITQETAESVSLYPKEIKLPPGVVTVAGQPAAFMPASA
jgi:twitching motility protein PilT